MFLYTRLYYMLQKIISILLMLSAINYYFLDKYYIFNTYQLNIWVHRIRLSAYQLQREIILWWSTSKYQSNNKKQKTQRFFFQNYFMHERFCINFQFLYL